MRVSSSVRTSPPAPPPPGTGVTSSPLEPLWGPARPAFFSVDTNETFLADERSEDFYFLFLENSFDFFLISKNK